MHLALILTLVPLAALVASCSPEAQKPVPETYVSKTGFQATILPRPEEPNASYVLLDAWVDSPEHLVTVSKRTGSSGVNYTKRRVDCRHARFLTLGLGETVEAMMQERPDPQESDMVGGSSATLASVTACQRFGR